MFGAGGGTSSYREIEETDVVLLWGSNARETHPIFFHHLLKGVHAGQSFPLHRSETVIGREETVDVPLLDDRISRRRVRIVRT